MRVIVVGCGRAGAELALRMFRRGHEVTVVDQAAQAFGNLPPGFRGRTVQGDVLAEDVLTAAGVSGADGLAAVTASDAVNAVVAHAARSVFGVKRVVVRSYAPSRESIHEAFGLPAVSSTAWGAQKLEEMLEDAPGESETAVGSGEVRVWRLFVPPEGAGPGFAVVGSGWSIAAVTRAGRTHVPDASFQPAPGDVLHVAAAAADFDQARRALVGGEGR